VLDSGRGEGRKPVTQYDDSRDVEHQEGEPVNRRGEKIFDWMVTDRRRYIHIGIQMMQGMKAPEEWHRVLAPMHEIAHKVEQQEAHDQTQRGIGDRPYREADARKGFEMWSDGGGLGKETGGEKEIKNPEAYISDPTAQCRKLSSPPRPAKLPRGDDNQAT